MCLPNSPSNRHGICLLSCHFFVLFFGEEEEEEALRAKKSETSSRQTFHNKNFHSNIREFLGRVRCQMKEARGPELKVICWHKLFGRLWDVPAKIPGYPAKKICFPWTSRDTPKFLALLLQVQNPHPTRRYLDPKVWVCAPFSSLSSSF